MKSITHVTVLGLFSLFSVYIYLLAEAPMQRIIIKREPLIDIDSEEKKALEYLNYIRVNAGLIPLKENIYLKKAAKNHANYLVLNRTIGHFEDKNRSGFTGKFGSNRAIFAGYLTSMVIENISSRNFNHKESIDGLMSAIYHRFGFLDFKIDEIGIGISQSHNIRSNSAFVYDMGNFNLEKLCKNLDSKYFKAYVVGVCKDSSLKIDSKSFIEALNKNMLKNSNIVVYPFDGQDDIPPAFYDELPDPLPEYSVSGFPISISFNMAFFKSVKLLDFKLFNNRDEIIDKIIYTKDSDPNKRLKDGEFVLFPLNRLEWDTNYKAEVKYLADEKVYSKIWYFKTRNFNDKFYSVVDYNKRFKITQGTPFIFYFPPISRSDVLGDLKYPSFLDIDFIDKNTIRLIANSDSRDFVSLKLGSKALNLEIKSIN